MLNVLLTTQDVSIFITLGNPRKYGVTLSKHCSYYRLLHARLIIVLTSTAIHGREGWERSTPAWFECFVLCSFSISLYWERQSPLYFWNCALHNDESNMTKRIDSDWTWGLYIILAVSCAKNNRTEQRHDYERVSTGELHTDDGVLPQQESADDDWSCIFRPRLSRFRLH